MSACLASLQTDIAGAVGKTSVTHSLVINI